MEIQNSVFCSETEEQGMSGMLLSKERSKISVKTIQHISSRSKIVHHDLFTGTLS